jgi:glycosyltransferase involved in cell wall biosynthesis
MGAAARARFESMFTLEREVAATSSIYRELVRGGRRR